MIKDGLPFVLIPLAAAVAAFLLGYWYVSLPLLLIALFMAYFFRDPKRDVPPDADIVVSPADGRVTRVAALDQNGGPTPTVVSIFLSVFDVHINRAPITA